MLLARARRRAVRARPRALRRAVGAAGRHGRRQDPRGRVGRAHRRHPRQRRSRRQRPQVGARRAPARRRRQPPRRHVHACRQNERYGIILSTLRAGPAALPTVRLTIPEGHALRDIARDDAPRAGISPAAYRRAARRAHPPAGYRATGKERLTIEGFLFPATYTLAQARLGHPPRPAAADGVPARRGEGRLPPRREEEPDALRRADHRLDDRARGRLPGGPRQDRRRHLQPPARGHATRHRRDHPVPRGLVARAQRARPARHGRLQHAHPPGPAADADQQSRPGVAEGRGAAREGARTSTTSRSRAIPSGATTSRARSPTSSTSSRRTRRSPPPPSVVRQRAASPCTSRRARPRSRVSAMPRRRRL